MPLGVWLAGGGALAWLLFGSKSSASGPVAPGGGSNYVPPAGSVPGDDGSYSGTTLGPGGTSGSGGELGGASGASGQNAGLNPTGAPPGTSWITGIPGSSNPPS
jgi:hypothetical protein